MYNKEELYNELFFLNKNLYQKGLTLNLKIVGGAALIFNNVSSIETQDIDTITKIEQEVCDIIESTSLDINNDALDYIQNFDGLEFIQDNGRIFSNINIKYLSLGGVIKTKMLDTNPEKLENLRYLLEDELEVEMTINGIKEYIKDLGETISEEDIENFLNEIEYID